MKKIFLALVLSLTLWLVVYQIRAQDLTLNPFSSSYDITYDVDSSGITSVTEKVTQKNLSDNYFASSFSLNIAATNITDTSAYDSQGQKLDAQVGRLGNKSQIKVKFNQQIAGKGKEYAWTLKFKSTDFASHQGRIWQVLVPKISSYLGVDQLNLVLTVPVDFGDPTSIWPEASSISEQNGKINLLFDKNKLLDTGILVNFGDSQQFDFKLAYRLSSNNLLPTLKKVALPSDSGFQKVQILSIDPKPENVSLDSDGNYLAWFRLNRYSSLEVHVEGVAKLSFPKGTKNFLVMSQEEEKSFTSNQKYWEKDNPLIQSKLKEILNTPSNQKELSNKEKARLINQFVISYLKYDDSRAQRKDFTREGGLTVLNNPDSALSQEFSDLFITLARAANIPSRQVVGFAYSPNSDLRPASDSGTLLHSWPQFYDPEEGWIMIDPTWQATTGGVGYFSKFDLNHLTLAIRGMSPEEPLVPDNVEVDFSKQEFSPAARLLVSFDTPDKIFSGFPAKLKIKIFNVGSGNSSSKQLFLNSDKVEILGQKVFNLPAIPPFGWLEYQFPLRSADFWNSFEDVIEVRVGDQKFEKKISSKPFFTFKYFSLTILTVALLMAAGYLAILFLHLYRFRKRKK